MKLRLALALATVVTGLVMAFTAAISTPKTMQIAPKTKVACPPACLVRKETVTTGWCPWCPFVRDSQSEIITINFAARPQPPRPPKGVWYRKL